MVVVKDKEDGRVEDARAVILVLLTELQTQVPRFRTQPHLMTMLNSVRQARAWLAAQDKGQG